MSDNVSDEVLTRVRLGTSLGDIVLELDPRRAPETTANFLRYVTEGFYDGTLFHRAIDGFMVQGGGFESGMVKKSTHGPVRNEADNGLRNDTGTLAMARTSDPHSATAQFFINVNDNSFLDHKAKTQDGWGYCVFGQVVSGMDVVRLIEECETTARAGHRDVPVEDIVIVRAETLLG
jgi:peptidyl-prolyl cis-trans isomerase B (cyclophilin B)